MTGLRAPAVLPSLALAVVAALYVWKSYDYDVASRTLPWIAGVLALTLAAIDVVSKVHRERTGGHALRGRDPKAGLDVEPRGTTPRTSSREAIAFGWIGALVPLVVLLGFYAAILLHVFCYLRIYASKSGRAAAAAAFGVVGVLYLVFQVLMGYEIFGGILAGHHL